jgi:hypothetical protein
MEIYRIPQPEALIGVVVWIVCPQKLRGRFDQEAGLSVSKGIRLHLQQVCFRRETAHRPRRGEPEIAEKQESRYADEELFVGEREKLSHIFLTDFRNV